MSKDLKTLSDEELRAHYLEVRKSFFEATSRLRDLATHRGPSGLTPPDIAFLMNVANEVLEMSRACIAPDLLAIQEARDLLEEHDCLLRLCEEWLANLTSSVN